MQELLTNFLITILTLLFLIYTFFKHHFSHFKRKNVPHIPPAIPYGNTGNPMTRKDSFYVTAAKIYAKFKSEGHDFAGIYAATNPYFLLISPHLIKRVLSSDFSSFVNRGIYYNEKWDPLSANLFFIGGKKWRSLRTKLTPTFTSGKMKMMFQTLLDCSEPLIEEINRLVNEGEALDIKELVGCFSTDVIGSCAFGLECNSFKNPDAEFRKFGRKTFEFGGVKTIIRMICMVFPNLSRKIGVRFIPKEVTEFFMNAVANVVDYRENHEITRNDFMQLLIELKRNGELKGNELAAQAFVFFIAGFETSSTTLTYCLYELAQHKEIQNKVRDEIETVIKAHGGITYDALADLKYTNQVIEETLRKYPAVPFLNRNSTEAYQIPGSHVVLEKGHRVLISTYGLHMDPEYFPEPEKFDPERFSDHNQAKIVPYTYLPFGEGPRICIGLRFGNMQIKAALIAILGKFNVHLNSKTPSTLTWNPNSFILKSNETIYLDAEILAQSKN